MYLSNKNGHLEHYLAVVKLMSPQNILNKGFAIVKLNNHIISKADDVLPGQELTVQLASTEIHTIVKSKEEI